MADDVEIVVEPEEVPVDAWDRNDGLTPKQRLFCLEYVKDWNGTQAAIRAGYSVNSAADIASENIRKPVIVDAVARLMAGRTERTTIDAAWVLGRLAAEHHKILTDTSTAARRDRLKIIDMIGRHVDVRAFRTQVGFGGPDGGPIELKWNLGALTDEELETFERLLSKISVGLGDPSREGEADQGEGPGEVED